MPGQTQDEPASNAGLFAEILNLYLYRKEVSQTELADNIHVRPNAVSQWLSGNRLPNDSNLIHQIASYLDLSAHEKDALLSGLNIDRLLKTNQDYINNASERDLQPLQQIIEQFRSPIRKVESSDKSPS